MILLEVSQLLHQVSVCNARSLLFGDNPSKTSQADAVHLNALVTGNSIVVSEHSTIRRTNTTYTIMELSSSSGTRTFCIVEGKEHNSGEKIRVPITAPPLLAVTLGNNFL